MDRSPFREVGTSDLKTTRPSGDFDGVTRRDTMRVLLAKHERHTISGRQMMTQSEHAARVWARLHPGKPMHFEQDGDARPWWHVDFRAIERRLFALFNQPIIPFALALSATVVWGTVAQAQVKSSGAPLTPQAAADVMRRLDSPANIAMRPALPDGPRIFIMPSTPGAAGWLTFPPPTPRLRLDGTPLTQPPTVYGPVLTFPTILRDHRSR